MATRKAVAHSQWTENLSSDSLDFDHGEDRTSEILPAFPHSGSFAAVNAKVDPKTGKDPMEVFYNSTEAVKKQAQLGLPSPSKKFASKKKQKKGGCFGFLKGMKERPLTIKSKKDFGRLEIMSVSKNADFGKPDNQV